MVRCIHQYDARHPDGITTYGSGSHQTPFAVTDAPGKVLRAYPSMKEMGREERLKPAHRNWLILQLKHPDRVKQHALRVQHHRGDAFYYGSDKA